MVCAESRTPRANALAKVGFASMEVGFIPRSRDCERVVGWRALGLGYPFFHQPVHVHGLMSAASVASDGVDPPHFMFASDMEVEI